MTSDATLSSTCTDVCVECGKPVDQAVWTIATRTGYKTETLKMDRDSRGLGRYCLIPKRDGLPYARSVTFEGTHNLHVCEALRDQGITHPTEPWVEPSEDEIERRHWSNCPDVSELGYQ